MKGSNLIEDVQFSFRVVDDILTANQIYLKFTKIHFYQFILCFFKCNCIL